MEILLSKNENEILKYVNNKLKAASETSSSKLIILMPEKYHYEGLKLILDETKKESISNVEVLSFNRFYHRIFEEANCFKKELSSDDKLDAMLNALGSDDENLALEMLRLTHEIDEEEISISDIEDENVLKHINAYYDSFKKEDGYSFYPSLIMEAESIINNGSDTLKKYLDNLEIVSFKKNEYTNAEIKLFKLLEEFNPNIKINIMFPYIYKESFNEYEKYDDFDEEYFIKINIEKIKRIISNAKVSEIKLDSEKDSEKDNNLPKAYLNSMNTISDEVYELAYNIKKDLSSGVSINDITVLVNSLRDYASDIDIIFNALKIPYHYDREVNLTSSSVITSYQNLLKIVKNGFKTEDIFRLLKSNFIIKEKDLAIDKSTYNSALKSLEKKLKKNKALSFSAWDSNKRCEDLFSLEKDKDKDKETNKEDNSYREEEITIINIIRDNIKSIKDIWEDKNSNKYLRLLEKLYELFYVEKNETIYKEKLESIVRDDLSDDKSILENYNTFSLLVSSSESLIKKRYYDEVLIEDFASNTLLKAKHLYILGMSEKDFKVSKKQIIVKSDKDTNSYYAYKYSCNSSFIRNMFNMPEEKLVVSYVNTIGSESASACSLFTSLFGDNACSYLTTFKDKYDEDTDNGLIDLSNKEEVILFISRENIFNAKDKEKTAKALLNHFKDDKNVLDLITNIYTHKINDYKKLDGGLAYESIITNAPYSEDKVNLSYSSIDTYTECTYKYYCEHIAHIKKDEDLVIENSTFGSIVHKIFELVFKNKEDDKDIDYVFDENDYAKLTPDVIFDILKKDTIKLSNNKDDKKEKTSKKKDNDSDAPKYEDRLEFLFEEPYYEGYLKAIIKSIMVNIRFVVNEIKKTNFKIINNEVPMGLDSDNFVMKGFIDRVDNTDKSEKVSRIIDYKTGMLYEVDMLNFNHMQLYIYEMLLLNKDKNRKFASLNYIPLHGNLVNTDSGKGAIKYELDVASNTVNPKLDNKDYKYVTKFIFNNLGEETVDYSNINDAYKKEYTDEEGKYEDILKGTKLSDSFKAYIKNIDVTASAFETLAKQPNEMKEVNEKATKANAKNIEANAKNAVKNALLNAAKKKLSISNGATTSDDSMINIVTSKGKVEDGLVYTAINEIAKNIKEGTFETRPLETKNVSGCRYCDYKNVCEYYENNSEIKGDSLKLASIHDREITYGEGEYQTKIKDLIRDIVSSEDSEEGEENE